MFFFHPVIGLVLHSSFSPTQIPLPYYMPIHFVITKKADENCLVLRDSPSILIRQEDDHVHKFLHYNFTMFRCLWGGDMTTTRKADIFGDMSNWLDMYNTTLTADFAETDDWYAWSIWEWQDVE